MEMLPIKTFISLIFCDNVLVDKKTHCPLPFCEKNDLMRSCDLAEAVF